MRRSLAAILFVLFLISWGTPTPVGAIESRASQRVPGSATVTVHLLKAPGLNHPGSRWEIAYELRMLPESRLFEERAKLNESSTEHAGNLIGKATIARSLQSAKGQTLLLNVPFDALTLDKLKNQPRDRLATGADARAQTFVFYSVVSVHDAKLKKTLTIPVSRTWDFANFPDARFEINIAISDDERIDVRSSSLKSRGITIERRPK
jgi:hypothetical protein